MGVPYLGDFPEDATVYIGFNTFTSDDPSASCTITNLADADIKVHKDGSTDEIVTDGATVAIDFDGITGNHLVTIDTSVHADYSTGSDYLVRMEGTTVDGATINAWIGHFSIENRYNAVVDNNLDHLMKVAVSDRDNMPEVVDDTVLANIMTKTDGDTSDFDHATDSLEAIRDKETDIETDTAELGAAVGATISADIAAVKAETAAIVNDTDIIDDGTSGLVKIASDVAAVLVDTGTTLDTLIKDIPTVAEFEARSDPAGTAATPAEVATALTTYDAPTKGELDTAEAAIIAEIDANETKIDALNNLSAAEVNAEVVDALNVDTYAEPAQGAPAATASLVAKIGHIYKAWRNKVLTTATQISIYNDAGDTVDAKSTISDDATTFTKGEYGSGP